MDQEQVNLSSNISGTSETFLIRIDNRIGAVELTVPANTKGPPAHWHEMHDETFLVTQGMIRFTWHPESGSKATKTVDAHAGDYVVVSGPAS